MTTLRAMPSLLAETGPLAGQRFEVNPELTVGRVRGDVVISDPKISGRHACFRASDVGGLEVEDLGSTNGTRVDGSLIESATVLDDGAVVRIGETEFTVVLDRIDKTIVDSEPSSSGAGDHTVVEFDTPPPMRVPDGLHDDDRDRAGDGQQRRDEPVVGGRDGTVVPRRRERPARVEETIAPSSRDRRPASVAPSGGEPQEVPLSSEPSAPLAPRPAPSPSPAGAGAQLAAFGAFSPPASRRGGLATRSWVPVVLSYGSAILAAAALVVYFVTR
jgi:pSer/pThr/pTyr-binding forkhead associated (FHA) protein